MKHLSKILNWIKDNFFVIILLLGNIILLILMIRGKSDYKSLETDFKAKQDTIDIVVAQNKYLTKYAIFWHLKSDSLDKEILNNQHIRYVNKVKYIKVQNSVDSLNDAEIDEYFSTGKLPR